MKNIFNPIYRQDYLDGYNNGLNPYSKATNDSPVSAFNEGFKTSSGNVVLFLDSDDFLYPGAVENAIECFENLNIAKVHWPLNVIDAEGENTGEITPKG